MILAQSELWLVCSSAGSRDVTETGELYSKGRTFVQPYPFLITSRAVGWCEPREAAKEQTFGFQKCTLGARGVANRQISRRQRCRSRQTETNRHKFLVCTYLDTEADNVSNEWTSGWAKQGFIYLPSAGSMQTTRSTPSNHKCGWSVQQEAWGADGCCWWQLQRQT